MDYRRTHDCGTLNASNIGEKVILSGWMHRRRDHGGLIFIDLRDRYGLTQLIFDPRISKETHEKASSLRSEWVMSITGKVRARGEGLANPKLKTGEIEIEVESLQILSKSKTPPFSICDEFIDVNEELRLKYRFLDIRRGKICENLVRRHQAMFATRNFLNEKGFLEITTPILAKSTPEGARDYLVPSRISPGNFFALPQSPQIYKQLLMISGMDRYFQIATCFRDEDLRAERQPEFTQIDLEMSFSTPEELFQLVEDMMSSIFKNCIDVTIQTPFRKMSYRDAMEEYGTDKPDTRFGMKFVRIDDIAERSEFSILKDQLKTGGSVKAFCVKGGAELSRREIDRYTEFVQKFGVKGVAWMKREEAGFTSSVVKFFSQELLKEIQKRLDVETGDLVLILAQQDGILNQAMDHLRRHIAKERKLIPKGVYEFLWVTEFPMFAIDPKTQEIESEHHPFTSPHFDDIHLLEQDPLKVRALAYDLVLNGYEIASGSQRIHDSEVQKKIFELLNLSQEEIQNKFGFFIEALLYGTPPHLGIALGFDRINMILSDTDSIRDVIAYPKTQKAADLMMQAPSSVLPDQLHDLRINVEEMTEIQWT